MQNGESVKMSVPVVAFECKTHLDKTMLESSVATAEKSKMETQVVGFVLLQNDILLINQWIFVQVGLTKFMF